MMSYVYYCKVFYGNKVLSRFFIESGVKLSMAQAKNKALKVMIKNLNKKALQYFKVSEVSINIDWLEHPQILIR